MNEILILGETREGFLDTGTLELITLGRKLADNMNGKLSLLIVGSAVSDIAAASSRYSVDRIFKIEHPLLGAFSPDLWIAALEQTCQQVNPGIFLMSHNTVGMELAPRLGFRLNTRVTTDCIDLSIDPSDGLLLRRKPVCGGNAMALFKCCGTPQIATIRTKVFEPASQTDEEAEVLELAVKLNEDMSKVESLETVKEDVISLEKADVVVAGGAGLGDEEGFEILEELAKTLSKSFGNVMIGCSRVAVDKGWISSDHQVGLTGTMISPDLYVAVGISGAIQHLVGMIRSKKIIAINTDPTCNIFKVADYGIVEDYEKVIPALIKKLEA